MDHDTRSPSSNTSALRAAVAIAAPVAIMLAGVLLLVDIGDRPLGNAAARPVTVAGNSGENEPFAGPASIDTTSILSKRETAFDIPDYLQGPGAVPPEPRPIAVAYSADVSDGPKPVRIVIEKGEAFVDALRRAGIRSDDRNAAAAAFGKHYNMRRFRPGQELQLVVSEPNRTLFQMAALNHAPDDAYLMKIDFRIDPVKRLSLKRSDHGFEATATTIELEPRRVVITGSIEGSLFLSAKKAGASDKVIADFANVFAYDVDFQRDIFGGDEFEIIYETLHDETGAAVDSGEILYGRLNWRNRSKDKGYSRYASLDSGSRADYFDATGQSAKRLLMKTPIDGARLSSSFGTRRHPILGYQKAHKGVDFAAPTGTPIKAAGSGTVERAGPYGTFGNYIKIRHANGYKTAYAHLSAIKRGVRAGARVSQGDIIGYVGTTGRSTGPHLHYEVHLNNVAVNPQNLKIATGISLTGKELEAFKRARDAIDAMRTPPAENPANLVAEGSGATAL